MILRTMARRYSVGVLAAGLLVAAAPTAGAATTACTYGNATAQMQAFPPLVIHRSGGEYPPCQYRVFFDGDEYTFQDTDWILAGIVSFYDYKAVGVSRTEGIADLEKWDDRLWLAPIGPGGTLGAPVEQELMITGYRNAVHPVFGLVVYRQAGVILHLPPGDYLSVHEATYDGDLVEHNEVTLHIVAAG
jgi:hypothetical protein